MKRLLLALSLLMPCQAWAATVEIRIDNFTFTPAEVRVAPGTTIVWINADDIPHAIAASDKSFKSKVLDTDDRYTLTVAGPGTIAYFCSLHPHMTGRIIVDASRGGGGLNGESAMGP
ncbi:MAG: cupredoxin family copper-binding protein [Azospirillaceae bacterium]|nr:cupredoxin family copper-binding protein [Azospirillaceae bacterium]